MYTNYYFLNVVSNMLFNPDNLRNTLLQIEVIFNIGSSEALYMYILYIQNHKSLS